VCVFPFLRHIMPVPACGAAQARYAWHVVVTHAMLLSLSFTSPACAAAISPLHPVADHRTRCFARPL
jgi:hypothetical protein